MAQEREIFAIQYDNGEKYGDTWIGIYRSLGVFDKLEMAEEEIKKLQIAHDRRIKTEIEAGYMFPDGEDETWTVIPIKYTY